MVSPERLNVAIVNSGPDLHPETFIQAQKKLLPFNITYYYDGRIPTKTEGQEDLSISFFSKVYHKMGQWINPNSLSASEAVLKNSFINNKIQVVLVQYGPTGEDLVKVCSRLNVPLIVHFHGYDAHVNDIITQNNSYKLLFDYAFGVIGVSKSMISKLASLGCSIEKTRYLPCGPDDYFLKIEPNHLEPHFIGVGRFTNKKAPHHTIRAFAELTKEFPDARLTIAGDGELYNDCVQLVNHLGIKSSVDLPGLISREQYLEYTESALAFVQHSVVAENGDSEGTPVAILEASAAGLPVISTNHAGIPDVVIHGETGILVEEHDIMGMAEAMKSLLVNKELAKKLGHAGKERIRNHFTMGHYIKKLSEVIDESIQNHQN